MSRPGSSSTVVAANPEPAPASVSVMAANPVSSSEPDAESQSRARQSNLSFNVWLGRDIAHPATHRITDALAA